MKKLLLLLVLALAALTASAPQSFAYDKNPWKDMERMAPDLKQGFDALVARQRQYGSSPAIRGQMAGIRRRLDRWKALVGQRAGDPSVVRKVGENIGLDERNWRRASAPARGRGTEVHVYHHFW